MLPILSILRHFLTFGGGFLVQSGTISQSGVEQGVGAVITLAGLGWSIYNGKKDR